MAYTMVTKSGDMTISSLRRQFRVSFKSFDPTFEVTENGGVIHVLQEEKMVLHGQWTYFEENSRDGGEEFFQDEACGNDDDDGGCVAGEENK